MPGTKWSTFLNRASSVPLWEHGQRTVHRAELRGNKGRHVEMRLSVWGMTTKQTSQLYINIWTWLSVCVKRFLSHQVERESVLTTYTENERSMLKYLYDCVFFVARKPAAPLSNSQNCDKLQFSSVQKTETTITWPQTGAFRHFIQFNISNIRLYPVSFYVFVFKYF